VLSTLYPIKEEHYNLLKSQLLRNEKLKTTGNRRLLQKLDAHDPMYITDIGKDLPIFDIM